MRSAAFDYELPLDAIAQEPCEPRDASRLLIDGDPIKHGFTRDLPTLLRPGDVLIVNETRVLPARLSLRKPTGGRVEVLALEEATMVEVFDEHAGEWWEALVRPSRRVADGVRLLDDAGTELLEVGPVTGQGTRLVRSIGQPMGQLLNQRGSLPLPPYIEAELDDPDRYQTVYANQPASVAAPTAGLHLTNEVLQRCRQAGAVVHTVELSVGVGTFRPLETEALSEHQMHSEQYRVDVGVMDACSSADRVVAVGTTVVRALESVGLTELLEGRTDVFIQPGFEFKVVDALLTNFHLPRSTLLVMLEAFMGARWRDLYNEALASGYRFLSFGDAMFVSHERSNESLDPSDPG